MQAEPNWDCQTTRDLAQHACFDCHSNETVWPWYGNISPMSWLIQRDVDYSRRVVNFPIWDRPEYEVGEAREVVRGGYMPPSYDVMLHPQASLTPEETSALADGLRHSLR